MAGITAANKAHPDVLFNLTPEDDGVIQESDLLQLINYGQVCTPVDVVGTDGTTYKVEMALLWDEDYIDILKRTSEYAADVLLRARLMKRLKIHRSIQRINAHNYADKQDPAQQRELWNILCHLSDVQMDILHSKYEMLEFNRNTGIAASIAELNAKLDDTSTLLKGAAKAGDKDVAKAQETALATHEALFQGVAEKAKDLQEAVQVIEKTEASEVPAVMASPKQGV